MVIAHDVQLGGNWMIRKTFNITGKRIAVLATALLFASLIIAASSGASNAEYADPSVFSFSLDADGNPMKSYWRNRVRFQIPG